MRTLATRSPAWTKIFFVLSLLTGLSASVIAGQLRIDQIEPTPLFPRTESGQPLRQRAILQLTNSGPAVDLTARVTSGLDVLTQTLGAVPPGKSAHPVLVPDLAAPQELKVELLSGGGEVLAVHQATWQPQKKWKIFCVSYSHHDLGFGNYPHRLRTEIRHANIERPLKFCTETDGWEEDSKFRFVIETSEPITSFLGSHSEAEAAELARRIREGRIQLGAVHNTANTEQMSYELLARLFYLSGRHTPDLLKVPASNVAQIDDVIGLTWPLATYCQEAGIPFFFHGHNGVGQCLQPASAEPVFYWQGPDRRSKVLMRSIDYGGYAGDNLGDGSEKQIQGLIARLGRNWPYDVLLCQDGTDFQLVTLDVAHKVKNWNSRFAYPRLVCATMSMFFEEISRQSDPAKIKTFAKDSNNQWADQDATDAWLLGLARRQGEAIPTAEKFATVATALAGKGYPWTDLYQAYHRLLQYHEHTDAIDFINCDPERMRQYETELEENREMVTESREFSDAACQDALDKLATLITTRAKTNLLVFNPLARARTDVVRVASPHSTSAFRIIDSVTGKPVPHQALEDGTIVFVAQSVPAMGYKAFDVLPAERGRNLNTAPGLNRATDKPIALENRFYRLAFDAASGAITSIRDKELGLELVDQAAPDKFNEYLYERYESGDPSVTSKWHRARSARLQEASGPVAGLMKVQAAAAGVESMSQTVVLYHDLKRIDFILEMVKSPSGRTCSIRKASVLNKESAYLALPFAVPDFRFVHELPGCVAEPIRDQFDGSCTAYYAMRHFADVANARFGITVSSPEIALVEYGRPRSCLIPGGRESQFERDMRYPPNSRMYLYLLDNMFDVNIRWDQQGPMRFTYSIRSHAGDWRAGRADQFGWDILNPLISKLSVGKRRGPLPGSASFLQIDQPNVECTTLKPAEANGAGFIARFHETHGIETTAKVVFPSFGKISAACETDLVENDRDATLHVSRGNEVTITIAPFGVKTIRLRLAASDRVPLQKVTRCKAVPVSDMQVGLSWGAPTRGSKNISHYNIYRGATPDFQPSPLHLVGRYATTSIIDQPRLNYGGWINHRVEPATTYYYRVSAVDRGNHEGPLSEPFAATTLMPSQTNMVPLRVEALRAILVSPISRDNFVNLLFRTSCEADVRSYEIHRSTLSGFVPGNATRVGAARADEVIKGSTVYGHVPMDYQAGDYDHVMFRDQTAQTDTSYFYRVCAVDAAGQHGPFSAEAAVHTKPPRPPSRASASSVYAPEYPPENAIDGSPDPFAAWISKPYGGGTKEKPLDVWWQIEFPGPVQLRGAKIIGDHREIIPLQKNLQVQARLDGWKTIGEIRDATTRNIAVEFAKPVTTDALRIFVPAADLPHSERPDIDAIVRLCEVYLVLPDGTETPVLPLLKGP